MSQCIEIYVDGACRGNPGPGGWGVLLRCQDKEKTLSGAELDSTNNRMELMAAIQGLNALTRSCQVDIYTDSQYVKNGITKWIHQWRRQDWKNSEKKPVKNKELWQALVEAEKRHEVTWHWVKGHNNHPDNDRADELAVAAIDKLLITLKNEEK
jgi:ribonuclease HI